MRVPRALFDWLDLKRSIAIIAIVCGGYAWYVWSIHHAAGPAGAAVVVSRAVTLAPLVAFLTAPALIGLLAGYVRWVKERALAPWQGRYHAFDDHQIRVVEARDILWFSSVDVHRVLAIRRRPGVLAAFTAAERHRVPEAGEVLSNAGLFRLLGKSTDRRTLRLLTWAERDVHRLWQKQRNASVPSTNI